MVHRQSASSIFIKSFVDNDYLHPVVVVIRLQVQKVLKQLRIAAASMGKDILCPLKPQTYADDTSVQMTGIGCEIPARDHFELQTEEISS